MTIRILHCAPVTPHVLFHGDADTVALLVETQQGLVLVDSGLGLQDHLTPNRYMNFMRRFIGWHLKPESTAIHQLKRMGITPTEVQHIILTHAHFDRAGGLPDFPHAQVHIHRREYDAIHHPKTFLDRIGKNKSNFAHHPDWHTYDGPIEDWYGFNAIQLPFTPSIYLVELHGHTSGHCGVAIEKESGGWLFNVGDASLIDMNFGKTPDWAVRLALGKTSLRLKNFTKEHPEVEMLTGHVSVE